MTEPAARKQSPAILAIVAILLALAGGGTGYKLAPSYESAPVAGCSCEDTEDEVARTIAGYDAALDALVKRVSFLELSFLELLAAQGSVKTQPEPKPPQDP